MQHFCKYNPKSKRCIVWFNKVCNQCREQFPRKAAEQISEESEKGLITAEECYSSIRRSAESESEQANDFLKDDIWWKVPMVLLICGSVLGILMLFCFLCQRIVYMLQVPPTVDIDICERESSTVRRRNQCCDSEPTDRRSSSTCRTKPNSCQRSPYY